MISSLTACVLILFLFSIHSLRCVCAVTKRKPKTGIEIEQVVYGGWGGFIIALPSMINDMSVWRIQIPVFACVMVLIIHVLCGLGLKHL